MLKRFFGRKRQRNLTPRYTGVISWLGPQSGAPNTWQIQVLDAQGTTPRVLPIDDMIDKLRLLHSLQGQRWGRKAGIPDTDGRSLLITGLGRNHGRALLALLKHFFAQAPQGGQIQWGVRTK